MNGNSLRGMPGGRSGVFGEGSRGPGGGVGVILRDEAADGRDGRQQGGRFYVLEVSDRGEVGIWRRDGNTWVDLVPWQRSDAVLAADRGNLVEATAVGSRLTLLVNGREAASATAGRRAWRGAWLSPQARSSRACRCARGSRSPASRSWEEASCSRASSRAKRTRGRSSESTRSPGSRSRSRPMRTGFSGSCRAAAR